MKKTVVLGALAGLFLFSCSEDEGETTPLIADFTATVSGESPNAQIEIVNNSTGATSYEWTFEEGTSMLSSTEMSPSEITVDKAGELTIKLVVSNGSEEEEVSKTISVDGNNAILSYTDIEFALNAGDDTYGRLFSFETGEMYMDDEVDDSNGSKIHLAFGSMSNTMYYFESPTVEEYNVSGATATKVTNYESTPSVSVEDFDSMTDDRDLSELTIENTEESFGNSSIPGTVLFELSTGQKGVIKTKAVNSDRLLVDIKIQKY